ncbi:A-macroglobulin complement component [Pelomyxa schiedti]|nr:A-macroglobulin complement component [Pelomyxa schiedti]
MSGGVDHRVRQANVGQDTYEDYDNNEEIPPRQPDRRRFFTSSKSLCYVLGVITVFLFVATFSAFVLYFHDHHDDPLEKNPAIEDLVPPPEVFGERRRLGFGDDGDEPVPRNTLNDFIDSCGRIGKNRFDTHISTDKSLYKPGDTVFIRAVLLDAFNKTGVTDVWLNVLVSIASPRGDVVFSDSPPVQDSVLSSCWQTQTDISGGDYTVTVSYPRISGPPPSSRKFTISAFRTPKVGITINFPKSGYGPTDTVTADVEIKRNDGSTPENADVSATATIDGLSIWQKDASLDKSGIFHLSFVLPDAIKSTEGFLNVVVIDGGAVESKSKTIPLILSDIDIDFYPEGGDIIPGITNRVYFEVRSSSEEPISIVADLQDKTASTIVVSNILSYHEGRGSFEFLPKRDHSYEFIVKKPSGIREPVPLPFLETISSVCITTRGRIFDFDDVILLDVNARSTSQVRKLTVTIMQHEKKVSSTTLSVPSSSSNDQFACLHAKFADLPDTAVGVLTVTVFNSNDIPMAERLIFRKPKSSLSISVTADHNLYTPGSPVTLNFQVNDTESGAGVMANLGIVVTDDAVFQMLEPRKRPPRLPSMALLEHHIDHLTDPASYIDLPGVEDDITVDQDIALDLLLGTQGWRRFAYSDWGSFEGKWGDNAKAMAVCNPIEDRIEERALGGMVNDAAAMPEMAMEEPKVFAARAPIPAAPPVEGLPAPKQAFRFENPADAFQGKMVAPKRMPSRPAVNFCRQYAHKRDSSKAHQERTDFTETVFWAAGVKTDANGFAQVTFSLSDLITRFRVVVDGFAEGKQGGLLGSLEAHLQSKQEFYLEPKLPVFISEGDTMQIPIVVFNEGQENLVATVSSPSFESSKFVVSSNSAVEVPVVGHSSARHIVEVSVGNASSGLTDMTFHGKSTLFQDTVVQKLTISPRGFPIKIGGSGMLTTDKASDVSVSLPPAYKSVKTQVSIYPTPAANLQQALMALIREPFGCFEQTSSVTYPTIMAQQYFKSHANVDPELIVSTHQMLDKGYKRLISFESDGGGFEWFGSSPAHEALTAYGVLEFTDMSKVYPVDQAMLDRTQNWLFNQRTDTGFKRNSRQLDSFGGAPDDITNAYIVWSLTFAGLTTGLDKQIEYLSNKARASQDPYLIGLVAGTMYNIGNNAFGTELASRLVPFQKSKGEVAEATTSITLSRGDSLLIETTAISILSWLNNDEKFAGNTEKAVEWLSTRCKDGAFGSTQSTVLALKAIIAYDVKRAKPPVPLDFSLILDNNLISEVHFDPVIDRNVTLPDFADKLSSGNHVVSLQMKSSVSWSVPFSVSVDYISDLPASNDGCEINFDTSLAKSELTEGDATQVRVSLENKIKEPQGMVVAIVGLPGGLQPVLPKLQELVTSKAISFFETSGPNVVLYWRSLGPQQKVSLNFDVQAAFPGTYTGPASSAYAYYSNDVKQWRDPLHVTIKPK